MEPFHVAVWPTERPDELKHGVVVAKDLDQARILAVEQYRDPVISLRDLEVRVRPF